VKTSEPSVCKLLGESLRYRGVVGRAATRCWLLVAPLNSQLHLRQKRETSCQQLCYASGFPGLGHVVYNDGSMWPDLVVSLDVIDGIGTGAAIDREPGKDIDTVSDRACTEISGVGAISEQH
jgi:hypothetical protein